MFYNLVFFLVVAAIVIAVVKPKSKTEIWLYSIAIPIFLVFWVALFDSFFSDSYSQTSYKLASALGESMVSILVTIPTIFIYLKKKLIASDQFKFPKGLIVTICIILVLQLFLEWGNYRREKATVHNESEKIENVGQNVQIEKETNESQKEPDELSSKVIDARKILPELVALINQGLPISREGMTMNSLEIKNNAVVLSLIIDEKIIDYDKVINDINTNRLDFFQKINANNQQIINNIISAEYDYIVDIKASPSGKNKGFTISANELKKTSSI